MKFEGIICPMISPFTVDGRIYADGVRNLIEFLHKNSVNGILVCGTYGLGPAMMPMTIWRRCTSWSKAVA